MKSAVFFGTEVMLKGRGIPLVARSMRELEENFLAIRPDAQFCESEVTLIRLTELASLHALISGKAAATVEGEQ